MAAVAIAEGSEAADSNDTLGGNCYSKPVTNIETRSTLTFAVISAGATAHCWKVALSLEICPWKKLRWLVSGE